MELDEGYQNIYTLRKILSDTKKTNLLQTKIKKLLKCKDNFLTEHDIKLLKTTKIPLNYKDNVNLDYLEYIRNCRFFWRHTFLDRIMKLTIDTLKKTSYKHIYDSDDMKSYFFNSNFQLL